jgi:hypothetical protein
MRLFRAQEVFRILVIAAMMAALASAAGELVSHLITGFDPGPLVALSLLVCLEGVATDRLARQIPEPNLRLRLHLVEWVVILLLLRLTLSLSLGLDELALAVPRWLVKPQSLLDGGLMAGAMLLFLIWMLGVRMSRAVEALGPEAEVPPPRESAAYYAWLTRPRTGSRAEGWQELTQLFLVGGAVLLICSGLARLDVRSALSLQHPAIAGIVGNALLYFVLGFTLLAQGHYAMLRAGWERNGVEVSHPLARRWILLGLGFAVGVALLVLLLPVRPSLALFGAVFDALWMLFYHAASIVFTALAIVAYLLGLLSSLFGLRAAPSRSAPVSVLSPPQPPPQVGRVAWWEAIQGFVLWAVIVAVLAYALTRFVRERRALWLELAGRGGPLGWLVGVLATLWRWLGRTGGAVRVRLQALVSRSPRVADRLPGRRRPAWPRPRTLAEQVRLLYLVALQQAARQGWPRQVSDTPYEYARRLAPHVTEGEEDVQALTEAFVGARYSRHEFQPAEVSRLRRIVRRLRRLIAARGTPGQQARPDDVA